MVPVSQGSLGREDMAEATCGFSVVSPLSIFVALRGPPLKLEEDSWQKPWQEIPSGYVKIAIENDHL